MKRMTSAVAAAILWTLPLTASQAPQAPSQGSAPSGMPSPGTGQGSDSARDNKDAGFVRDAARGGMKEVELGKIASRQATNAEVKAFGSRMVADHTKANDEQMALARSKKLTVPTGVPAAYKADIDRLSTLSGAAFDRAYVTGMVADHEKTVALFETESKSGTDADIKAWALKTLPTLRDPLKMVKELHAKIDPTGR